MTKAEKMVAEALAVEMESKDGKAWAAFNRTYAAHATVVAQHEIDKLAYKLYMQAKGLVKTDTAGGHYATLSPKAGATFIDYDGLFTELRQMGIDVDALKVKYTGKRPDTWDFKFK